MQRATATAAATVSASATATATHPSMKEAARCVDSFMDGCVAAAVAVAEAEAVAVAICTIHIFPVCTTNSWREGGWCQRVITSVITQPKKNKH